MARKSKSHDIFLREKHKAFSYLRMLTSKYYKNERRTKIYKVGIYKVYKKITIF